MLQFTVSSLFFFVGVATAAYSSSTGAGAGAGAFSGSFGSGGGGNLYGNGVNYGTKYPYANNGAFFGGGGTGFAGVGSSNFLSQFPLVPPIATPNDYNNWVQGFWKQFGANFQNAATMTYSTPGAAAFAFASSGSHAYSYDLLNQQLAHQAHLQSQFSQGAQHGHYGGGGGGGAGTQGSGFYAPNFAGASASYGPGGFHQAASLIPQNPNSPNLDTRFGGETPVVSVSSGQPGFVGVSTSSFSSSSDVNGQRQSHRQATTSINDNGKVTTYTVKS